MGLQIGILLKGSARLLHVHIHAHFGLQHHVHPQLGEDGLHFHQLVGVLAGQYHFHVSALQYVFLDGLELGDALGT